MEITTRHSQVFHRKFKHPKPTIVRGEGVYLWDANGRRYIDASGGPIVVNVGHGVREIADAIGRQAASVAYAHASMFTSATLEEHAARLARHMPMPDARLFYMCSGSEATETAMKFARQYQIARGEPSRWKIISRWGSYHGATLGALSITGKPSMRDIYSPMFTDMPKIAAPYCYRCPFDECGPDCGVRFANLLAEEIERQGPETVAAFIAEPISGATLGAVVPPDDYWPRIREICDQYRILLIDDEVMTGMGRTGRWFGIEHWGVTPDVMCLGKGVSGGYLPLSITAVRGDLVDFLLEKTGDFNHGGTFSHQPVAAAAGLATLAYLEQHDLVSRAARMGEVLGQRLREALGDHPHVGDIRGKGLMWGIEFVADRATRQPFPANAGFNSRVFDLAFEEGVIVYAMGGCADGTSGDHVMVAPPFVVNENQIGQIVSGLQRAIDQALESLRQ